MSVTDLTSVPVRCRFVWKALPATRGIANIPGRSTFRDQGMPDLHQRIAPIDRPDQTAVEADLAIYFGHQAEVYLRHYRRQYGRHRAGRRGPLAAWSWPAFSASLAWFWYRKLWLGGVLSLAIPMVGGWLPGGWGGVAGYLLVAALAKDWYLRAALGSVTQADAAGLTGPARHDFLAGRGGTSWPAGALGGVLVVALGVAAALAGLPELLQQIDDAGLLPP